MLSPADLKSIGLKATVPWLKILEIFQTNEERHMSTEDVYRILLAGYMDINLATVCRVLAQFEQTGLLSRNNFESGKVIYELNGGKHHDHPVCLDCGHVEKFFDAEIERRQQSVARARDSVLQEHAFSLYGNCTKETCPHRSKR